MVRCDYCGRTYPGAGNNGLIGGWYNVCSERCRLEMRQNIAAGKTREYQNPTESGLKLLVRVVLICMVGAFITSRCKAAFSSTTEAAPAAVESRVTRQESMPSTEVEQEVVEPIASGAEVETPTEEVPAPTEEKQAEPVAEDTTATP